MADVITVSIAVDPEYAYDEEQGTYDAQYTQAIGFIARQLTGDFVGAETDSNAIIFNYEFADPQGALRFYTWVEANRESLEVRDVSKPRKATTRVEGFDIHKYSFAELVETYLTELRRMFYHEEDGLIRLRGPRINIPEYREFLEKLGFEWSPENNSWEGHFSSPKSQEEALSQLQKIGYRPVHMEPEIRRGPPGRRPRL